MVTKRWIRCALGVTSVLLVILPLLIAAGLALTANASAVPEQTIDQVKSPSCTRLRANCPPIDTQSRPKPDIDAKGVFKSAAPGTSCIYPRPATEHASDQRDSNLRCPMSVTAPTVWRGCHEASNAQAVARRSRDQFSGEPT